MRSYYKKIGIIIFTVLFLASYIYSGEPESASESKYNKDISKANTSEGLTKADLAWHAKNTYGWDCDRVIFKGEMTPDGYYIIECYSGLTLRVYPRKGQHPKITNSKGTYESK